MNNEPKFAHDSNAGEICNEPQPAQYMKELTDPRWIKLKGILFLLLGILASTLLLLDHLEIKTAILLAVSIWCFCRSYYFAFYVIEHYLDPSYRFAGLLSFVRYLFSQKIGGASKK